MHKENVCSDPKNALNCLKDGSDVDSISKSCAPIALFVYNRPEHTRQTVESLRANDLSQQSDLFVFADAARDSSALEGVEKVRAYVSGIEGFRSVSITRREHNLGLSKSIVDGVTKVCLDHGRVIVVEDDIQTAPDFLPFINQALKRYEESAHVFSIGGFNLPITVPESYAYDAFCSYRFQCWGWATWKDRWKKADWSVSDYQEFRANRQQQERFNRGGDDLSWLLGRHMTGKIDSWDTVWAYTHSKYDGVALLPIASKTRNMGFDGSGIHCRRTSFKQNPLSLGNGTHYRFPDSVTPDPYLVAEIRRLQHRSMGRRLARRLYDGLGLE